MFKVFITLLFLILIHSTQIATAALLDDFVIGVVTANPGTSNDNQFNIPTFGSGYNYNVDCNNDGTIEASNVSGDYLCLYDVPGVFTIRIIDNSGTGDGFPRIYFHNAGDKLKINRLNQWGTGKWKNMSDAFWGCENMVIEANDVPNFSQVQDMSNMFQSASLANPQTKNWDTSNVITMRVMFQNAFNANPDTTSWDTSQVTHMDFMFAGAISANPNTSNWDISMVTDMTSMFFGVTIPTTDYDLMLVGFYNQTVNNSVNFHGGDSQYCSQVAIIAHAKLNTAYNWGIIDAGQCASDDPANDLILKVKSNNSGASPPSAFIIPTNPDFSYDYNVDCDNDGIFEATGQNDDYVCVFTVPGNNTIRIIGNLPNRQGFPAIYFNNSDDKLKIVNILQWGTSKWVTMIRAFHGTNNMLVTARDIPDFSQVQDMGQMFQSASIANPTTTYWDTSEVTNMSVMFQNANSAQPNTSLWNTSKVEQMAFMFAGATNVNPETSDWDIGEVLNMTSMFLDVTLPTASYDAMLIGFDNQVLQDAVNFHGGNSTYCAIEAHNNLESALGHNWTLTDGGLCEMFIFIDGFE